MEANPLKQKLKMNTFIQKKEYKLFFWLAEYKLPHKKEYTLFFWLAEYKFSIHF